MEKLFRSVLFIILMVISSVAYCQPPGDPGGGGKPGEIPLGGVELLLLGGAGLTARKILSKRKRK